MRIRSAALRALALAVTLAFLLPAAHGELIQPGADLDYISVYTPAPPDTGGSHAFAAAPPPPVTVPLSASALAFNFTDGPNLAALQTTNPALYNNVVTGFQAAGDLWRAQLGDAVTVNVTINYAALGAGILGSTNNETMGATYSATAAALAADATSADDATAVGSLQPGPTLDFLTNDTSVVPSPVIRDNDGSGNNSTLDIPRGNARALGLLPASDAVSDGAITFSDLFTWDFDRSNGISGGTIDFVGVAAHEIGHLLGFVSGVDIVDWVSDPGPYVPEDTDLDIFRVFSVLDLYRYSLASLAEDPQPATGALLDLAFGDEPFFSIDAGATDLATFATGQYNGDGRQASHWKDSLGLGLMDPTFAYGEFGVISALDIQAFDVIGWDLVVGVIPEPCTLSLLGIGLVVARVRRRRGRRAA